MCKKFIATEQASAFFQKGQRETMWFSVEAAECKCHKWWVKVKGLNTWHQAEKFDIKGGPMNLDEKMQMLEKHLLSRLAEPFGEQLEHVLTACRRYHDALGFIRALRKYESEEYDIADEALRET